jgi:NTE family protein
MSAAGVSGGECRRIGRSRGAVLPPARRPRTGLVLGAGGVVGAAWMTGALHAVQQRLAVPVGAVDLIVGTSAGSVLAAALRCGVTLDEMTALQRGEPVPALRDAGVRDLDEGPLPPRPHLRAGSPRLMLTTLCAPRTIHPGVGVSAWLPRGRGRHEALHATVAALDMFAARRASALGAGTWSPASWADGRTWIVAVNYDTGRRVMFGRSGAPPVPLADAVVASCSIPGWYEPAVIDGHHYVDGGVRSSTSMQSLVQAGLDEVYVLAPMASLVPDRPARTAERLERRLRRRITRSLLREAAVLQASGVRVTLLTPGPEDLAAMGVNVMDPRRRGAALDIARSTSAAALAAADGHPQVA